ncbi:murein hydrolase activator EnvC family protein [Sporofaciens musculi]|jgi:murein DD-endopeptidase MepM/ murein hydrolase activator NlpD|uniref:murein hydrolase activator EnvC family protein n=1 Tax=Sporofaciens musculi TaxID=2681861 RepID=UPI002570AEF4|nr:M23 family metallopeptidase [Sporofaciens musculi]
MILRKKIVSLLMVFILCFGMAVNADASEISETEKKAKELEEQKKAAEGEKESLEKQLNGILTEMDETKAKIEAKEIEVREKEEELVQAKIDENDQYESMKKRIKYMYENGNSQFIEILCESKSIGEFLNNAEYITTISQYDRNMLTEFQQIVQAVAQQEETLKAEYAELETMQDSLIAKQEELNELVEGKEEELEKISADLGATQEKLKQLKEAAEAAARKQEELARLAKAQSNAGGNVSGGAGASVVSGNGMFTHPCPGYSRISSEFGWREAPIAGASNNHKGMDLAAPTGTPIYAAAAGTVTTARYSNSAGNWVVINHGNGLQTYYMHASALYVSEGQTVSKGQNIAAVGSTGQSTGPHLHFQVMQNGTPVNPRNYL